MGLFSKITKGLGDIGGSGFGLGDIVEGVAGVKTIVDLFDDEDVPRDVRRAGTETAAIARALADPNDPMFRALAEEEEGLITRDYARALKDVGTANRRMMARTGGLGILDPERRDESLAGAFAKSYTDRKQAARDQARAYLSSALTANQAVAGAYAPMIAADQRDRERQSSGMQMLLDLFEPSQTQGVNFDVSLRNPPGLSFGGGGSSPSTYTTPGFV